MPLIIRLCLHAVCADGSATQVWLSFSIGSLTSPKNIIFGARKSVEERMGAHLAVDASFESQMSFCMRGAGRDFIFLGTAAMKEAESPIMKMPFVDQLLRDKHVEHCDLSMGGFVFVCGALVPLSDLSRINHENCSKDAASFAMYDVVKVPPVLSGDPVILEPSLSVGREDSVVVAKLHASGDGTSSRDGDTTAGGNVKAPLADKTDPKLSNFVSVQYVDFSGKQYKAMVPQTNLQSIQTFVRVACDLIGAQAGCVFNPVNMSLMCIMSDKNSYLLDSDISLKAALKDVNSRFYLAVDARLLESPLPKHADILSEEPVLMLKENHRNKPEEQAVLNGLRNHQCVLATSAATLWELKELLPTPSFSLRDQNSILRSSFQNRVSSETEARMLDMRSEEDAARLSLASAHFSLDETLRRHKAAVQQSTNNATCDTLCKKRDVLAVELTECMSADRDCQRLEMLLSWLEKDVADGHVRQEKLIRALYAV